MLTRDDLKDALWHYYANLFLIWLAILFYKTNAYYKGFIRAEAMQVLLFMAIGYTIFAFPYYLVLPVAGKGSKGSILLRAMKRVWIEGRVYLRAFVSKPEHPLPRLEQHEKTALLFVLVKIFFLPIMLTFFFNNYFHIKGLLVGLNNTPLAFTADMFFSKLYPAIIPLIFLLDTLWFSFGYAFEFSWLKNTVKSVEPTVFGWIVALMCYPPFNSVTAQYAPFYTNELVEWGSRTMYIRFGILIALLIYLWATFALGAKCSNLTNRGIVTRGPYGIVRHPAYIAKNISWWIMILPILSWQLFFSAIFWIVVYTLRAITEERHLIKDPDYVEYCKNVKWRFIPYVI
ncbi:hypothetical protein J4460_07620 [Candidatus Woesearchaeota archaeon]|nr:MAG: hypothetical protein QS99_C0011G0003 [archaeon GW2011_AR4]MBS3130506.1 hypothetical protein [Candidatus Woesearchaeota archaeon]HIH37986.1 hypothetical protein [Candidatus Woesearchaeota archaeon]HIH49106.1 hypothetical protein [Candidatus Woesearchaeota archaeon]HIJ02955.1 hypothetical protein [Candidatus Woesearchaeota archaeon]